MRVHELASLDLAQIDEENERFRSVSLKGGLVEDVHFNVAVTQILRPWLVARSTYRNAATERALFLSDRGRRLSVRAVEDLFQKYTRVARLDRKATPHVVRHSTATELVRLGAPVTVVAEALHHQSIRTTQVYVHAVGAEVHAAIARLATATPSL